MELNKDIFVFGSNLAGIHGAGSAKRAMIEYGAIRGLGTGRQGNSYAIPTKDRNLTTLGLNDITDWIDRFIQYAKEHPELTFRVVNIGCGLAGYTPEQIAPLFRGAPTNCKFSVRFQKILDGADAT